uniref:Receptor expression-enhancing protein n=1 Tax=Trichuris muris TaxID=70415 RepID=A0A5S6QG84_TRIMR
MDKSKFAISRDSIEKFRADLTKRLHQDNGFTRILGRMENVTGVDRIFIVAGVTTVFALYLIIGYFSQLLCNVAGFAYPAYASFMAIESPDKKDDTQWLTYWVVFAFLNVIEFASEFILSWFPVYYLCKFVFLLYLHLPMTMGAEKLYNQFVAGVMHKVKDRASAMQLEK